MSFNAQSSQVQSPQVQTIHRNRTDNQWIADLTGKNGPFAQQCAHADLLNYLFVVTHNYLKKRYRNISWLSDLSDDELAMFTQDIVQTFVEKMVKDDYALLAKYSGIGKFTAWASQVAVNATRSELRRVCWSREEQLNKLPSYVDTSTPPPGQAIERRQVELALRMCLDQLPIRYRTVLVRCTMNGEAAADVAADLDCTAQAVHNLTNRAKKALAGLLAAVDVGPEDLGVFVG